ncbi:T9SS type A sorting domain-containing protein [Psychroserpens sp.]|uniref:T9SS type A sorting domain-containing protein n=1 Tax=Psychroserpens sp. TaxID=2020870 RepID=UPI001B0539A5|nr:T9SS type A sorting domain-containing protein [Psychroserpens sp.]MBO6605901.1 T9SS type A sorting domain-containing protein [Psychroserpens sp.]MBO6630676.1 T9SS type A sorting domain-containing protein [Psychroserpens sp.]MBO6652728.1 T9SS type A sorting domain-containing protein [Psychroserpens sp.]MBO6681500.1 T9SS type A sorting domain-containing protein [Psychroserpens sp.]MBO6749275.1 T9SS type A sorting domain-containing protein [Psychroserpens sp.]
MSKKYFLTLLIPFSLFAQDKFSQLDKSSMNTSILYDRVYKVANLNNAPEKVNATYFIQAYSELAKADYENHFGNLDRQLNAKTEGFKEHYIPIGVLHTQFDILKPNVFEDGILGANSNNDIIQLTPTNESVFKIVERSIVSPLTTKWRGLNATFKLNSNLITNSTDQEIMSIKANFNNGLGYQTLEVDQEIEVQFASEGEKKIDFQIVFHDGSIKHNSAYINIGFSNDDINLRAPGDEGPITAINATIPYQGFGEGMAHIGTGEYKIFFDNVDGVLDKPIIFVDGFDPGDGRNIPLMYSLLDFGNPVENLADLVRDEGFDLVVLNFPTYTSSSDGTTVIDGGADFIQRNAFILTELIQTINGMKTGNEQNVIIGPSMGGLISRYALRYMEQNALDHDTRLYLSFDSPHKGANVPIGIQYLFNYMLNGDPGITAIEPVVNGLLNSAAARQMLVDHYSSHLDAGSTFLQDPTKLQPDGAPNFRDALQGELDAMGFPQNTRNVSVINGSGIGATTGSTGASIINHTFDTGIQAGFPTQAIISANFTPAANATNTVVSFEGQVFFGFWVTAFSYSADAQQPSVTSGVDSAPGGLFDLGDFDEGGDPLIAEFVLNLDNQFFDFIPSVSAMALDDDGNGINWFHDIQIGSGSPPGDSAGDTVNSTPFVNWYMPDTNEDHVLLTDANVMFALSEIMPETLSNEAFEDLVSIKIQSNPIQDVLTILSSEVLNEVTINMFDITGKSVLSSELTLDRITDIPLNLETGLYILNIETKDNYTYRTKIIVR